MFFLFGCPFHLGSVFGAGRCLFWPLPILTSPCRMGTPDFLPRSIDVKLGDFPEGVSSLDIVRSLLEFFQKMLILRWWRFNSAQIRSPG